MATFCNQTTDEFDSPQYSIFAEHLEKIGVLNLYICIKIYPLAETVIKNRKYDLIVKKENCISFSWTSQIVKFEGLCLQEDAGLLHPRSVLQDDKETEMYINYRLRVSSSMECKKIFGSCKATVLLPKTDTLLSSPKIITKSQDFIPKEDVLCKFCCQNCNSSLGTDLKFKRVRSLPSGTYWMENAQEVWFCHPPSINEEDVTKDMGNVNLSSGQAAKSCSNEQKSNADPFIAVKKMIESPEENHCYHGVGYILMNPKILTGLHGTNCRNCQLSLASIPTCTSLKLWDFGARLGITNNY